MRRWLALLVITALSLAMLAGCGSEGDTTLQTIGEGVSTEGRAVFYEFFTDG